MRTASKKVAPRRSVRATKVVESKSPRPEELDDRSLTIQALLLLHRTRDMLFNSEDRVFSEFGLTAEQYTVLVAIKYFDDPVRPTDIGRWVGHKVNTVSMIVDRMVNAGLVRRLRDLPDRREVRLVITSKGEQAFKPATPAAWSLIDEIMSSLSDEEKRTLIKLLERVRDKALQHMSPDAEARGSMSYEATDLPRLMKRLVKYVK
ncbi:MAG: MarR family transcriptional regulator [Dehalococcoidia bacterium]|nr:MarR family transcriptional regulator [Dehalococcoidia bacterium]